MKHGRRKRLPLPFFLFFCSISTLACLFFLSLRSVEPDQALPTATFNEDDGEDDDSLVRLATTTDTEPEAEPPDMPPPPPPPPPPQRATPCATVEKMGRPFARGSGKESLRVRKMIQDHFVMHGAPRVRGLPAKQFCRQGFVMGKASEAGLGNEMYKILTGAALSVILNRSLIIGQSRGKFPFEDYISYTNLSFTLKEVKHLWRQHNCESKHGRRLIIRTDDFEKPSETNVLCSDWTNWRQPIIWFQGTTDAVGAQFFLKNVHIRMRTAAAHLFGDPGTSQSRPNVFGELMRVVVSPSQIVEDAVNWVLNGGADPDVTLHMRMRMNKSIRALRAALNCIKKALNMYQQKDVRPRVALVSDTPSLIRNITLNLQEFSEVIHFDYKKFRGNLSGWDINVAHQQSLDFRMKDWGPAPRWVAFVDFFLASRAKHAVVTGAHRRVGTTYAQLIAAMAAANHLDEDSPTHSRFSFFSSFQSNLLADGLGNQIGWGHVWNRFSGPLSCRHQGHQCAFTPLLALAWWDGPWQSPIARDVRRLQAYGVHLTDSGEVIESHLSSYCQSKKETVKTLAVYRHCKDLKCSQFDSLPYKGFF